MRLKTMDGPLSIYNGNNISKSAKRTNTLQNSNVKSNYTSVTANYNNISDTSNNTSEDDILTRRGDLNILKYVAQRKLQWRKPHHQDVNKRGLTKNVNNRNNQLLIIDNTLTASLANQMLHGAPSSARSRSERSLDDSFLDYEEAQQSYLSADTLPQTETYKFDTFGSESSDNGNRSNGDILRGSNTLNPEYLHFSRLPQSLGHGIKVSNTYFVEGDHECDSLIDNLKGEANENNNNNNAEHTGSQTDNQLESGTELVFNTEGCKHNLCNEFCSSNTQDGKIHDRLINLNANVEKKNILRLAIDKKAIINISEEVKTELGRVILDTQSSNILEDTYKLPNSGKTVLQELEETIERMRVKKYVQHLALKYNVERSFFKLVKLPRDPKYSYLILKDSKGIMNFYLMTLRGHILSDLRNMPKILYTSDAMNSKVTDAFLSNAQENVLIPMLQNKCVDRTLFVKKIKMNVNHGFNKPNEPLKEEYNREQKEIKIYNNSVTECKEISEYKHTHIFPPSQEKEKVKYVGDYNQHFGSLITFPIRDKGSENNDFILGRSVPKVRQKKPIPSKSLGSFDVCNIETAMPKIDLEAIELQLRAAREEERRRKTDREEIRRRLAMGSEDDYHADRPGRKPSLQARLQSGMNLQICFMNETVSDNESSNLESESPMMNSKQSKTFKPKLPKLHTSYQDKLVVPATRPAILPIDQSLLHSIKEPITEADFSTRQARLQTEARMALAQAKEMARMQMEIERQRQKKSPITEMVRHSLEKVGIPFSEKKRRLSRQILTEMNVAQLQVIVNDLHTQIESLNEGLVKFLMDRDDLHMEQDSMLVDIEDLTRYLGAKEQVLQAQNLTSVKQNNNSSTLASPPSPLSALNSTVKPHLHRIANLIKK